ncbi:MAG: hypothetical protein RL734_914 [Bacteroidota bacterium]|jgi:hypothetical protein
MSIKVNKSGKRRGSEIYFVLYLSALILLLPGKQEKKSSDAVDAITALFQQSFSLLPEKNSLLSKITTDSSGASILQLDTSNVLLLTGNVSDISFECIVEDQNNDEVIQVASKEGEHFSIVYDSTKKLVFFSWHPPISMLSSLNKSLSYVVTVKAKAKPFISGKNPELQQLLRSTDATLQTEARFSISILTEGQGEAPPKIVYMPAETTFTRMIFQPSQIQQQTPPVIADANGQKVGVQVMEQEFTLQPREAKMEVMAFQEWQNKIFVQGIYTPNDYAEKPIVNVVYRNKDMSGTANLLDFREGSIIVGGVAPASNAMTVKVTSRRKYDNKEVTTEFIVDPKNLNDPIIPNFMYPFTQYKFNPEMPTSNNMDARAILRNSQRILEDNQRGLPFTYKPDIEDTGTVVYFERLINGKPIGKSYSIRIRSFEPPQIIGKTNKEGQVEVFVRSFGKYDGKPNRCKIIFAEGTAVNIIAAQDNSADFDAKDGFNNNQKFSIRPKDKSKPFSAMVHAVDKYGKLSEPVFIDSE